MNPRGPEDPQALKADASTRSKLRHSPLGHPGEISLYLIDLVDFNISDIN